MANISNALRQYQTKYEEAKAANLQRYDQAMTIYDEIINRYRPGGSFGQAALQQLETQKTRDVGKETHDIISSGLYGTTEMGATGRRWEADVGAPSRLRLEDLMMERLSQAQIGKAGFMERREDVYPDLGQMAQLTSGAAQRTTNRTEVPQTNYGETYGASSFPDMFSIPGESGYRGGGGSGTSYGPSTEQQAATKSKYEQFYKEQLAAVQKPQQTWSEEELQTINKQIGNIAPSSQTNISGMSYENWLKTTGKGATAKTLMDWQSLQKYS